MRFVCVAGVFVPLRREETVRLSTLEAARRSMRAARASTDTPMPPLQRMVRQTAILALGIALVLAAGCLIIQQAGVARGIVIGVVLGIVNSAVLARRLDRALVSPDDIRMLSSGMRTNMIVRFSLVLGIAALALGVSHVSALGLVGGLAGFMVLSLVVWSRAVVRQWRAEGGMLP